MQAPDKMWRLGSIDAGGWVLFKSRPGRGQYRPALVRERNLGWRGSRNRSMIQSKTRDQLQQVDLLLCWDPVDSRFLSSLSPLLELFWALEV